jgi:hypothetical protein
MDEVSEWFLEEFGYLGFDVTPIMYNPDTFTPIRGVLWRRHDGAYIITNIKITTELITDVEYKSLLRDAVNNFLESQGYREDFTPNKKINKLKL